MSCLTVQISSIDYIDDFNVSNWKKYNLDFRTYKYFSKILELDIIIFLFVLTGI